MANMMSETEIEEGLGDLIFTLLELENEKPKYMTTEEYNDSLLSTKCWIAAYEKVLGKRNEDKEDRLGGQVEARNEAYERGCC